METGLRQGYLGTARRKGRQQTHPAYCYRATSRLYRDVPCEGGISHNEIENAKPEDLAAGCNVLLQAVLTKAG